MKFKGILLIIAAILLTGAFVSSIEELTFMCIVPSAGAIYLFVRGTNYLKQK